MSSPNKIQDNGYLWCLLAYQSTCWFPGTQAVSALQISIIESILTSCLFSVFPNLLQSMNFHYHCFSCLYNVAILPMYLLSGPPLSALSPLSSLSFPFSLLSCLLCYHLDCWLCSVHCFLSLLWLPIDASDCSLPHIYNKNHHLNHSLEQSWAQCIQRIVSWTVDTPLSRIICWVCFLGTQIFCPVACSWACFFGIKYARTQGELQHEV